MFSLKAAAGFAQRVLSLRAAWHQVRDQEFFTLGSPVYQHAPNLARYLRLAKSENAWLRIEFRALYKAVFETIRALLASPISLLPGAAIPGFHIFEYSGSFAPHFSVHFDLSYKPLGEALGVKFDSRRHLSFTLPLSVAECRTGLDLFDITLRSMSRGFRGQPIEELARQAKKVFVDYSPGEICLISGHNLHRISFNGAKTVTGHRITLQGHLIRIKGGDWVAYW